HALTLGPLEPADVEQLIAARTGIRQVPAELLSFCQERAEGHPLLIEATLRERLVRELLVVEHGGVTKLELAPPADLPRSLDELLVARFAQLPDDARAVLEALAALGGVADVNVLAAMTDEADLESALTSLEGEHLVVRKDASVALVAPTLRNAL